MRSYPLLIIIIFMLIGCTNKNRIPNDILSPKLMQELVWDVMVADEYSKDIIANDSIMGRNLKGERSKAYKQVFDLHNTSRKEFVKSFNYYTSHPDLTKALFDTLAIRANKKREASFRVIMPKVAK